MPLVEQVDAIEFGLAQLGNHVPNLPTAEILATRLLVHLGREMSNQIDQRLRPHGLSDIEFRTLMSVYVQTRNDSNAFPGELCGSLGQSPANMTRLSDSLVQRGLIQRLPDAEDRRRLGLRTTAEGDQLVNTMMPVMLASVRRNYSEFPRHDLDELIHILKRLAAALDKLNASGTETLT